MIYKDQIQVRELLSESDSKKMAKKYSDNNFKSTDLGILCEAYNKVPLDPVLIREFKLNKYDKMALLLISEQSGVDPEDILLEKGMWSKIKKLGKNIGAVVTAPFKAAAAIPAAIKKGIEGKKQGATVWQSAKYGLTALPSMFSHGTHFGQGEASEKAKAAYAKILKDFENTSNQQLKELVKAAKELESSDFPNNARPEDFRTMLYGKEDFAGIETGGDLTGLLGAMLNIRQGMQMFVDNGGDLKVANKIVGRMRKMLQYYMGELKDSYQSLENKNLEGQPLLRGSTAVSLMDLYYDSNYWYNQVCEGILTEGEDAVSIEGADDKTVAAVQEKLSNASEKELAAALFDDAGLEGLDDEHLNSMKLASSALRPILIACLGAAIAAFGWNKGGSLTGDFENSDAMKELMKKFSGDMSPREIPEKIQVAAAEYFDIQEVRPGEGLTQIVQRTKGLTEDQIQNMDMGAFVKMTKESGINPETMAGLMKDPEAGFKILADADPTAKVGDFLKGMGKGSDALSLSTGVGKKIMKQAAKYALNKAKLETVKLVSASTISKMFMGAALPTILATTGVAIATSGVAVGALRKFAKNRKKTLQYAIDLLTDIEGPIAGSVAANPPDNGPIDQPNPDDVQGLADELPLDLFKRSLKDKEYEKPEELADEMFKDEKIIAALVQNTPPKPQALTAGYRKELKTMLEAVNRWNKLAGLQEDVSYDDFSSMVNTVAKNANLPELNDEQMGFGAQALNVTRGVGDVTNLPGPFSKEEFENKIDELEKVIGQMKLDNSDAVRKMLDELATKSGLDPASFKDKENSDYLAAIGETIDLDAQDIDNLHSVIDDLKSQLAAANAGLDKAEAELAVANEELNKYIEENSELIQDNEELKKAVEDAAKLAAQKDIVIGSLTDTIKQKDELNALKDEEIADLTSKLEEANRMIEEMKAKEDKLNSRLLDLRKLYLALSKASGGSKTVYDRKHDQKKREKTFTSLAKAFSELGDEYPALKDTGEIIKRSMDANITSSVKGSGQLKKGGGRNEPEARSKKQEASWKKGDLILEKLDSLLEYLQEGEIADMKYADANRPLSQEELDSVMDQISDEIEDMGSAVAEQSIADMWLDENEYLYRGIYIDTRPHQGGQVKIVWPGWAEASYRGDLGW